METNKNYDEELDEKALDLDDLDDEMESQEEETKPKKAWTIISALSRLIDEAKGSELDDGIWKVCREPLDYLHEQLGLTDMQLLLLAIFSELGEVVTWFNISRFLQCSRLCVMSYSEEAEELVKMRWCEKRMKRECGCCVEGFALIPGVMKALGKNQKFVPEKIDNLGMQEFVDTVARRIHKNEHDDSAIFEEDERWLKMMVEANEHLPICREIMMKSTNLHDATLLLLIVADYAEWCGTENEGLHLRTICEHFDSLDDYSTMFMREELRDGTHLWFSLGYIEHKCTEGVADTDCYSLTAKFKTELLMGYAPHTKKMHKMMDNHPDVKQCKNIKAKSLFYNTTEQSQIDRLASLLQVEHFKGIQERLEQQGFRKGFACLFYGAPGTGKTEGVLQLARQTGRDVMQVDIASMRDKYVGESEKNIKVVFTRYRRLCKESEVTPILFFNEADALINKRTQNQEHAVDKMNNAMQNIILQEMEDLDGILIATTNLSENLDTAFERRFLFKIEFKKPDVEVKAKIWNSMLGGLSSDDANLLARRFDFSGGQIENVARKRTIDYILSGKEPSISQIVDYCKSEQLKGTSGQRSAIGFAV